MNIIPGIGLGDLVTILLGNALPLGDLIPTGYKNPVINGCLVSGLTGTVGTAAKEFAGGFIGLQNGVRIKNCDILNSNYTVQASSYSGGFAGVARDGEIKGTITSDLLNADLLKVIQPQSLLIMSCQVQVKGNSYLGGLAGALASSYAVDCTIEGGTMAVEAVENYAGGLVGEAATGWATSLGGSSDTSLLATVSKLLTGLLGSSDGGNNPLLSLAGVAPSAILGCQIESTGMTVRAGQNYAGGFLGRGDGVKVRDSSYNNMMKFPLWQYGNESLSAGKPGRACSLNGLQAVSPGESYAGGIIGLVGTASAAGLLDSTLGVGSFIGFNVEKVTVNHSGENRYNVTAGQNYAGGAFGMAIGGKITNVVLNGIGDIKAADCAAGFVGCAGPGDLMDTAGGLQVQLLGITLLQAKQLLSLGQGMAVEIHDCQANGYPVTSENLANAFTVTALGQKSKAVTDYAAGGFIARSNSTDIKNSHVTNLYAVTAPDTNGYAGGFAADFQSGTVNNHSRGAADGYYAVYNLDHVDGQTYAGGFGGRLYSGALADAGKGLSLLGGGLNIDIDNLLGLMDVYVPTVKYAGVSSANGFTVRAARVSNDDLTSGSAGGFVGYASGAQISHSDVRNLKYTRVNAPDKREGTDGSSYFGSSSSYAVTGGRYAGGYVGNMDIGNAASIGGGLKALGGALDLNNLLSAFSVVVTMIDHSDVYGSAGGFAVLANGTDAHGKVGSAGGFVGNLDGGHIQDSNAHTFSYIIGQISAGGYVGYMKPGNAANVLSDTGILGNVVNVSGALASLAEDFVPTIRNSSTDCIPCGGAVRADAASDSLIQRGMAGGYAGYNEGGHIWGMNRNTWKDENDGMTAVGLSNPLNPRLGTYTGPVSLCRAERIRSVYGYEYAGGYTGYMKQPA